METIPLVNQHPQSLSQTVLRHIGPLHGHLLRLYQSRQHIEWVVHRIDVRGDGPVDGNPGRWLFEDPHLNQVQEVS